MEHTGQTAGVSAPFNFNKPYGLADLFRDGTVPWSEKAIVVVIAFPLHLTAVVAITGLAAIPFVG